MECSTSRLLVNKIINRTQKQNKKELYRKNSNGILRVKKQQEVKKYNQSFNNEQLWFVFYFGIVELFSNKGQQNWFMNY